MPPTTFSRRPSIRRGLASRRGLLALVLACSSSLGLAVLAATKRTLDATARLNSAVERLDSLTDGAPFDDAGRAAVAWGYAERLRLGLDSPFRLVEGASRDPRLSAEQRKTVAEALIAHVLGGEGYSMDAATLDGIGPTVRGSGAAGEQHLALITRAVAAAPDPRAGELAVRIAYSLAAAEHLVDGASRALVAGVAALTADREIARREALSVVRSGDDPVAEIRTRRARRAFYAERPSLLASTPRLERSAVEIGSRLLDSLRALEPRAVAEPTEVPDSADLQLSPRLFEAGALMPPGAPVAVAVRRYLPLARNVGRIDAAALARAHNTEMLAAFAARHQKTRMERRVVGRMLVAAAVAMRPHAQEPVWFPGDSATSAHDVASALGVSEIVFDRDVPKGWQPYFLGQLAMAVADLRRVLPALRLHEVRVRFRMTAPADSALAMHDPRTRTLHLPVATAGGALTHEMAHELDRQVAIQQGHHGYRSDRVARSARDRSSGGAGSVGASLRALTEDAGIRRAERGERPAEIFATQVDWFVARALASRGVSNGFLSGVQDELLTGHLVHPERLRAGARARPLADALRGMTSVAPFALEEHDPGLHALVRWALAGSVDREAAATIMSGARRAWHTPRFGDHAECARDNDPGAELLRMAAESRARGWIRTRARWMNGRDRAGWASAAVGQGPWAAEPLEQRVAALREHILSELADGELLPSGLGAVGAPLAARARCG